MITCSAVFIRLPNNELFLIFYFIYLKLISFILLTECSLTWGKQHPRKRHCVTSSFILPLLHVAVLISPVACLSAEVLLLPQSLSSIFSSVTLPHRQRLTLFLSWRSHRYSGQVVSLVSLRLSDPHRRGNDTPVLLSGVLDLRSAVKDVVLPEPERTTSPGLPLPARGLGLRNPRRRRCEYAG